MQFCYYPSPIGNLKIEANGKGITAIHFCSTDAEERTEQTSALLEQAKSELSEYFCGKRKQFTLPLSLSGTAFQRKVRQALLAIPYGETRSYADIAAAIGNPKACRAVGMANNKNPIAILVPCHRVIGKNGNLTGYAGGLDKKEKLLQFEQKYKEQFGEAHETE